MVLSKGTGALAVIAGILAGGVTIVAAIGTPENVGCITQLANALGPHAQKVGMIIVGAIGSITPVAAWLAKHPLTSIFNPSASGANPPAATDAT